jgi:hypothetical protein
MQAFVAASCTIAETIAENRFAAPWNDPSKIAEIALRQIAGVAGGAVLGFGAGLAHRFILRSLTLKITASIATAVGGLGYATYGIYEAWRSGNEQLFWIRLTCTTADFGMAIASWWRTLSRARTARFAAEADPEAFKRLNEPDPAVSTPGKPKFRRGEAKAAARGESELGKMRRSTGAEGGDFVIIDGPNAGKTVDFKISPYDSIEANAINDNFHRTSPYFRQSLLGALNSPSKDIIAIGIKSLNSNNQAIVHGIINSLPQGLASKIVLF